MKNQEMINLPELHQQPNDNLFKRKYKQESINDDEDKRGRISLNFGNINKSCSDMDMRGEDSLQ